MKLSVKICDEYQIVPTYITCDNDEVANEDNKSTLVKTKYKKNKRKGKKKNKYADGEVYSNSSRFIDCIGLADLYDFFDHLLIGRNVK